MIKKSICFLPDGTRSRWPFYESLEFFRQSTPSPTEVEERREPKGWQCDQCPFTITIMERRDLSHRVRNHRKSHKSSHTCHICGITTREQRTLTDHINVVHHNKKLYKCDECDFTTGYCTVLYNHRKILRASASRLKKFFDFLFQLLTGNFCGNDTAQKNGIHDQICYSKRIMRLRSSRHNHRKKHQPGYVHKKHICDHCAHAFSNLWKLKEHVDAVHLKLRPFKCDMCDWSTGYQNNLQVHEKKVHGVNKFRPKGRKRIYNLEGENSDCGAKPNPAAESAPQQLQPETHELNASEEPSPNIAQSSIENPFDGKDVDDPDCDNSILENNGPSFDIKISTSSVESQPENFVSTAVYECDRCDYREVQLNFILEIEVFHMLFERCYNKNRNVIIS